MGYWCTEQLIVTVNGPTGRSVVSLSQPFARVGSHPDADVVIPDDSVARRCLYLHATPEGVFCLFLDVASSNPDARGIWLDPDQDVAVGVYRVQASLLTAEVGDARPEEGLATWGSAPPPLPVVLVYCGDLLKDKRRFRARLSPLGRRPQCGLQLKGKKVSSFHCVLYWDREELWCIDLNSSNGTTLNGSPLNCAQVNLGDRLDVGEFGLVFQRLSSGGQRLPSSTRRGPIPEQPPHASREASGLSSKPATRVPPLPLSESASATPAPLMSSHAPVPAEPAALAAEPVSQPSEELRLPEQLAEEVARLRREREMLQARWDLASERWQSERQLLKEQLSSRAEQLAHVEADLAATTAELHKRLLEERSKPAEAFPPDDAATSWPGDLSQFAPAAIVAGFEPDAAGQVLAEFAPEVAWTYTPIEPGDSLPTPLDPQAEMQARWEATSQQLSSQVEQLRADAAQLAADRQALELTRDQWRAERQLTAEHLASRQHELVQQQAKSTAATSSLAHQLGDVAQRFEPPLAGPAAPNQESPPLATNSADVAGASEPWCEPAWLEAVAAEALPPAVSTLTVATHSESAPHGTAIATPETTETPDSAHGASFPTVVASPPWTPAGPGVELTDPGALFVAGLRRDLGSDDPDDLTLLVNERLAEKQSSPSLYWLWWSAGGMAVAAALTAIVIAVLWVL